MENKLKPCPFCGSTEIYSSPHMALVVCKKCRCFGPVVGISNAEEAIAAWNRRENENTASNKNS